MSRFKTIQYAFNGEGVYAKCGDKVAYFVLDFEGMKPENGFEMNYSLESGSAYEVLSTLGDLIWTKKVPVSLKNAFRKHFGMKPLKDDGKEVLLGGMTHEQYLCHSAKKSSKHMGHDMTKFKKLEGPRGTCYEAKCKKCGCEVFVNPNPAPNEIEVSGDVFGNICQ